MKKDLKNYLKRKDLVIEGNVATWELSMTGAVHGLYSGQFKFKCFLTPTEKLAAGRMYRELLGENGLLALKHEDNLAFSLSQLRFRVISGPPFWSSAEGQDGGYGDIPDENVLDAILEAALDSEFKYAAILTKKKEDSLAKAKAAAEKILSNKPEEEDDEEEK